MQQIKGLHHNAYRCKDSEETRRFYVRTFWACRWSTRLRSS